MVDPDSHLFSWKSDGLRYELSAFGIDVVLIEPGVINTKFADTAMTPVSQYQHTVYGPAIAKADVLRGRMEATAAKPEVVARAIHKALRRKRPAARYVAPWYGSIFLGLLAVTPTRLADVVFRRVSFLGRGQLDLAPKPAPAITSSTNGCRKKSLATQPACGRCCSISPVTPSSSRRAAVSH